MVDNRVLVIGLDGASWNVLEPLMAANKLPNLARLIQDGASGCLRSTVPPVTAPAWASFSTGVNPGKHGVFTFETNGLDNQPTEFISSHSVRAPRVWQMIGQQEKRVILINIPITYPPEPVNGIMISGMLTPSQDSQYTYPAELQKEILSLAPNYVTDINLLTGGRTFMSVNEKLDFIREIRSALHSRTIVTRHLMAKYPWDLFVVVFVAMDRIQHVMWRYLEPGDDPPPDLDRVQTAIHELYSDLDSEIGHILADAGEDVTVIIMSDHGFGPLLNAININRWLQQQGLLTFNETKGYARSWLLQLSRIIQWRRFVPESLRKRFRAPFDQVECLNWANTKVYSGSPIEQGIYINTPQRRKDGIVQSEAECALIKQEIKRLLPELKDPTTGLPVIEAIYEASELYTGPFVSQAADLIYITHENGYLANEGTPDLGLFDRGEYWIEGGYHRPDGILVVRGPDVKRGNKVDGAEIIDVTPTILYMLNLPLPEHLDGKVLCNLFDTTHMEAHPVKFTNQNYGDGEQINIPSPFSESENEIIRARLRSLGYIE